MTRTVNMDVPHLPPDVTYLEFNSSDGDPSKWPLDTTRIVDKDGCVNYFEYLPPENGKNLQWRIQIGEAVAKDLKLPVGPKYVLKSFPDGYRFFDHHKGPAVKPRQDVYLYGPHNKRFRSKAEFIPHATWLMNGMEGDCDCKYCSKRTQKEITAEMGAAGIISVTSMSPTPLGVKKKPREQRTRESRRKETRTYAAVRPVRKVLKPSAGVLKQSMLVDRDNDLRGIYATTSMELRRWFREEEVVWCTLERPIVAPDNPNISIQYWPGVVDEVKFKAEALPRPKTPNPPASSSTSQVHFPSLPGSSLGQADPNMEDSVGPRLDPSEEPVPWTVRHYTKYKIQLLAVSQSYIADDLQVLPYPAHIPPEEVIEYMLGFDPDKLIFEADKLSQFNPCSGPIPPSIFDAVPAYAAALQIASTLASYWSLTDEYEIKYVAPSPQPSPKPPRVPLPTRLSLPAQSAPSPAVPSTNTLESANNQAIPASAQTPINFTLQPYHRDIHDIGSSPESELQRTSRQILGVPPSSGLFVQMRFQGIWWGTERIWVDDFIRLKVPRRALAPSGTDHIIPPSGPGKLRSETYRGLGEEDVTELGAGGRGVFLRLDSIFAVDVPADDGTVKEARVCGMLYELADEDWEEPPLTGTLNKPSDPDSISNVADQSGPSMSGGGAGVIAARSGGSKYPNYPLPQPPEGYRLRPILKPGYEFIGALGLISGRYYPRILSHPKLRPIVEVPLPEGSIATLDNLWALEGLSGGYFNAMDPIKYKKSRMTMMQDADREALTRLREYAEQKSMESKAPNENCDNMDVDFDDIYA